MIADNYYYQCPYVLSPATVLMMRCLVYDEEYDEDICKHCKSELDSERRVSDEN
jgi:hypothetical protein